MCLLTKNVSVLNNIVTMHGINYRGIKMKPQECPKWSMFHSHYSGWHKPIELRSRSSKSREVSSFEVFIFNPLHNVNLSSIDHFINAHSITA